MLEKKTLQFVQLAVLAESLDRGDLLSFAARGQNDTTMHGHATQQNRAGTAVTGFAAALRARETESFSERI